ncbi:hypothetical protein JYU14_04340 [Simkania negevensis]|uniref:Lipid A biosynthesis lauroyl acyltransferase n=1 Tax=Simkania negevensis TaxID=83561 RepID=A0ABS3ARD6_9BACT|nr:hypothetical protein [Simkania negevensis]
MLDSPFFYYLLRCLVFPFSLLPYSVIRFIGRGLGFAVYYLLPSKRKRVMNNLALATTLPCSLSERKAIAKKSFQNLATVVLEYFRLPRSRGNLNEIVSAVNSEVFDREMAKGRGVVLLSGHQANWEVPILEVSKKHSGIAVGRPIRNKLLYQWLLSIRQMNGARIVVPKNALKEGISELRRGGFVGIVGDQAYPESSYSYPLLGTRAWTTPLPAILAYKAEAPLLVVNNHFDGKRYSITYSEPIVPDTTQPFKREVERIMNLAQGELERAILQLPGEWLWSHNRWKQSSVNGVKRKYRHNFILVIMPKEKKAFESMIEGVVALQKIYSYAFLFAFVPVDRQEDFCLRVTGVDSIAYNDPAELFVEEWKYQLVIDFAGIKGIKRHFCKLGAFVTLDLPALKKVAFKSGLHDTTSMGKVVRYALCKQPVLDEAEGNEGGGVCT